MTYITTHSGQKFSLIDPQPEDVHIKDVAHHLGRICRFNGAVHTFYSVAQHSVFVSSLVEDQIKFTALLHDAGEAYYGDMSSPFKMAMQELVGSRWDVILDRIDRVIKVSFNLKFTDCSEIRLSDRIAMATEIRDLTYWNLENMALTLPTPDPTKLNPSGPFFATIDFLDTYRSLQ